MDRASNRVDSRKSLILCTMMVQNMTLRGEGTAFLITHPEEMAINAEMIEGCIPANMFEDVTFALGDWLYYNADEEQGEELLGWQMPGIKLLVDGNVRYDEAKGLADTIAEKLKKENGVPVSVVVIDQERLEDL